ncbi:MAG: HAD hydrolase-like protein [Eubacteriales bacterium]
MKKYKHLVFDIDGTMIDSLPVHMVSLIKTLREITGREYTEEELKFTFGIPGDATMRQLGISDPDAAVERWLDNLVEAGSKDIPLFPGIRELLEKLQEKGVHLGIVTSKMRSGYIAQFTANGLLPFFDNVVTADDTPKGKPDPGAYVCLHENDRSCTGGDSVLRGYGLRYGLRPGRGSRSRAGALGLSLPG